MKLRKGIAIFTFIGLGLMTLLGGCGMKKDNTKKLRDIDYTVLSPDEYPEQLRVVLEEKKDKMYRLTYANEGYLYIAVGYGKQEKAGFSVRVDKLYETANGIYFDTTLMGPAQEEEATQVITNPSVVVKMEDIGKTVIFN